MKIFQYRRIWIGILIFLTVTGFCLGAGASTGGKCGETLTWELADNGTLTISGTGEMYDNWGYGHWGEKIKAVVIKEGVTSIGSYAFNNCADLTSVTIPDGVTTIEEGAFNFCTGLKSIKIPDSVTRIKLGAFHTCNSLSGINLPNKITEIGQEVFCNCRGLISITIPDSVKKIDDYAFSGCTALKKILCFLII